MNELRIENGELRRKSNTMNAFETRQYPLHKKIGDPDLMVGREKGFKNFWK